MRFFRSDILLFWSAWFPESTPCTRVTLIVISNLFIGFTFFFQPLIESSTRSEVVITGKMRLKRQMINGRMTILPMEIFSKTLFTAPEYGTISYRL